MSKTLSDSTLSLADLPIGMSAVVIGVNPAMRGRKKFADAGVVPGTELRMESHAPLGSLLRVKLLGSSLTMHKQACRDIMVKIN